ncbi:MAG: ABC transporter substrate binding protein [Mariprofundaceae bacterium]
MLLTSNLAWSKECFYVNSYHAGYKWSDDIEAAVVDGLKDTCHLTIFRMDTKRNTGSEFGRAKAKEAKVMIDTINPDVLIVSDDNASKYLVLPYYKNADLPVVFSGINWTAKPYGYPYNNATGMIEVSPIRQLLSEAKEALKTIKKVTFIAAAGVRTDQKEFDWMVKIYAKKGIKVISAFVNSMKDWEAAYLAAQTSDMIVLNNIAGIANWDAKRATQYVTAHAGKLTVTTYDFMMPFTMLGMTKVAAEQGQWSAKVAMRILEGKKPSSIPVIANRQAITYINSDILRHSQITLPSALIHQAINVTP